MSRVGVFFLLYVTPALALVLALLGLETLAGNMLGWFLLMVGITYPAGVVIVYWVRKERFWEPQGGEPVKEETGDLSFWLIIPGMLACFFLPAVEWMYFPDLLPRALWLQVVGAGLLLVGAMIFVWARQTVRVYYAGHVSITAGQALVQDGPYRFLRHPSYFGYLMMALGVSLGYSSLAGLTAIPLLLLPGFAYRIRVEERLLLEHFGAEYRAYASRTRRLLPFVW